MELAAWIFAIAMVIFIIVQFVVYVRANPIQEKKVAWHMKPPKGGRRSRRSISKEQFGVIVLAVITVVYLCIGGNSRV